MFSSFTKSLASVVPTGPRALLASYIATALSEHFVVDRDSLESSLLNEPRLVLLNTQLRRKRYRSPEAPDAIVTIGGEVREVKFSWRWSFGASGSTGSSTTAAATTAGTKTSGAGGMVQDATLAITGLKVRVGFQSWSEADEATRLECLDVSSSSGAAESQPTSSSSTATEGYLQKYIQQVIDHLTLKITDFEFALDLESGPYKVIIGGEDLNLETHSSAKGSGADGSTALSQKLSMGSFHVNVEEHSGESNTPATRHPLIEPFGYSASVTRLSGKRFQGGILSGLEVVGLPDEKDPSTCGVVVHAGREQMRALFALGKILAPSADGNAEGDGAAVLDSNGPTVPESVAAAKASIPASQQDSTTAGSLSTVFILPLPALTLVLPGTKITLPSATATYRTDGRLFRVQGHEGIQADGHPMIGLEEGGQWVADLVQRSFVIDGKSVPEGRAMATVVIRKDSATNILSAIESLASSEDVSDLAAAWKQPSHHDDHAVAPPTETEPWSFSANGAIKLRLQDEKEWLEAAVMRPSLAISNSPSTGYTPSKIECGGIDLHTCSKRASVVVPPLKLSNDGEKLHVTGTVEASVESADAASELGAFLARFATIGEESKSMLQSEPSGGSGVPSIPFTVDVQATDLQVRDRNVRCCVGQTSVRGNEVSCASISYTDLSETLVVANEVNLVVGADSSAEVAADIEKCVLPGLFELVSPLKEARTNFRDGELTLHANSLCLALLSRRESKEQDVGQSSSIPFPVNLKLDELTLDGLSERAGNREGTVSRSYFRGIDLGVTSSGNTVDVVSRSTITIRAERSQAEWVEGYIGSASIRSSLENPSSVQHLTCTGAAVASSSFGQFSIQVPSICLESEEEGGETGGVLNVNDEINVSLESTAVAEKVYEFVSQTLGLDTKNTTVEQSGTAALPLRLPLPFPIRLLALKLALFEPSIQVFAEDLDIAEYAIRCGSIHCEGPDGVNASLKEIFAIIEESKVVVESVESLLIPGVASLSEPMQGTSLSFTNDTLKIESGTLKAVLLKKEAVDSDGAQEENLGAPMDLPFRIRICLNAVLLKLAEDQSGMVQFSRIDTAVFSSPGNLLSFDAHGEISIRLMSDAGWIESKIDSPSIVITSGGSANAFIPHAATCAGVTVGPCSFGHMAARASAFALRPGTDLVTFDGPVDVEVESFTVVESLQSFVSQVASISVNPQENMAESRMKPLPFSIQMPEVKLLLQEPSARLMTKGIAIEGWAVYCSSAHFTEASGMSASMLGVEGNLQADASVAIESLSALEIPGVVALSEPIYGTKVVYTGGSLSVNMDSVQAVVSSKEPNKVDRGSSSNSLTIPIPIRFQLKKLCLQTTPEQSKVCVSNVSLEAKSDGAITLVAIHKDINLRLEETPTEWIEASIGGFSLGIRDKNGKIVPEQLTFGGGSVGPCSYGRISAQVPSGELLQDGNELRFCKNVEVAAESFEVIQGTQSLLSRAMDALLPKSEASSKLPFAVGMPGLRLSVSEPDAHLIVDNILAVDDILSCESVHATETTGFSTSVSGVKASIIGQEQPRVDIGLLEALLIPGVASLHKPVANVSLTYENRQGLVVKIPSPTHMHLVPKDTTAMANEELKSPGEMPSLPFPLHLDMFQLNLKKTAKESTDWLLLRQITIDMLASGTNSGDLLDSRPTTGVVLSMKVTDIDSNLFHVRNIKASALLDSNRMDIIKNLQFALESARITAGYSSVDWAALLGDNEGQPPKVVKTPFAAFAAIKLELSYKGMIAASETSIVVPPFVGDSSTTSEDLLQYYSKAVISRAPGFIANAEIMGSNVVDSTFTNAGRVAMTSSLTGAAAGSVVGIAAVDGVKGAIASGKKARNASIDEGYKFGDLTRGCVRAVCESTKSGAMKRRGESDRYVPGDFTAGASAALSEYTSSNKSRLSAAGGGGVGSVVGLALAGPIGFVAGSYLGSKAGSSAVGGDAPKEKQEGTNVQPPLNSRSMAVSGTQTQSRAAAVPEANLTPGNQQLQMSNVRASDEDLLGLGPTTAEKLAPAHLQQRHGHSMPGEDLLGLGTPPPAQSSTGPYPLAPQPAPRPTNQSSKYYSGHQTSSAQVGMQAAVTVGHAPLSQHASHSQRGRGVTASEDLLGLGQTQAVLNSGGQSMPALQQGYASRSQQLHAQAQGHAPPQQQHQQFRQQQQQQQHGYAARSQAAYAHSQNHASSQQPIQSNQGRTGYTHQSTGQPNYQGSHGGSASSEGYHFGDITKSIVAKGKKKAGREENSSYQFGDFTRGLFGGK